MKKKYLGIQNKHDDSDLSREQGVYDIKSATFINAMLIFICCSNDQTTLLGP